MILFRVNRHSFNDWKEMAENERETSGEVEVVDADDELANLFDKLGKFDKKIFELKAKIARAERFIKSGVVSNDNVDDFEHSLRIQEFKDELANCELERDEIMKNIDLLESDRFGEEIPRDKEGNLQVPWDTIELANAQVESVMGEQK